MPSDDASTNNNNIHPEGLYPEEQNIYFNYIQNERSKIEDIVRYHIGLKQYERCSLGQISEWMFGNFNVCIPVYIKQRNLCIRHRLLIRIPLPYKLGEKQHNGNVEEKLRCEAAAYIWISENCPTVPIPRLWAFGFPSGQCVCVYSMVK